MPNSEVITKICRQCQETKPQSDFPFLKSKNRFTSRCKSCVHKRQAAWLRNSRRSNGTGQRVLPGDINEIVLGQRDSNVDRIHRNTVASKNGCREWLTAKERGGYPLMMVKAHGRWFQFPVNRIVAALFHGLSLLDGDLFACHHCDNRACCEEKHIFVGTPKDNTQDMIRKGRHPGNGIRGCQSCGGPVPCKPCTLKRQYRWVEENRDRVRASKRAYQERKKAKA